MARPLTVSLTSLLDLSGGLGVGVVDGNGLLVQGCGRHGDQAADKVAAYLGASQAVGTSPLLEDALLESLLVGRRYCFYLKWLAVRPYLVYVMTENTRGGSSVRTELRKCSAELSSLLTHSGGARRERLEQPRQFVSSRLIR